MLVNELPLDEIYADSDFNCRGEIAPIDVVDLARDIEANGLMQAIVVQPWDQMPGKKYRLVAGYRRFSAHKLIKGKTTIFANVVTGLSELQARAINLSENLKRKDLNILQEAQAIVPFKTAGWNVEMISRELGQPRHWVEVRDKLLKLPPEIQQEAAAGFLTQEHIKQLSKIKRVEDQFEAVKKLKDMKLAGEKKRVDLLNKKPNPLAKKRQDPGAMLAMQDMIQTAIGNNFATRSLAWCMGEISEIELLKDLEEEATKLGKVWKIPPSVIERAAQ